MTVVNGALEIRVRGLF